MDCLLLDVGDCGENHDIIRSKERTIGEIIHGRKTGNEYLF